MNHPILVIGGGLAGCEAAWQIAKRGGKVTLQEMRPAVLTEAHKTDMLCELVCSNSFRSSDNNSAPGLLKEELRIMGSLIMKAAETTSVPSGASLAVDRKRFSSYITDLIYSHKNISVVRREALKLPDDSITVVATGPLTSDSLTNSLLSICNCKHLYFYDAISPIISADSIDHDSSFFASRYNKGGDDYLNCPMTKEEYEVFWKELVSAQTVSLKDFEDIPCFEACMPVEDIAKRGKKTLLFGPMKPVGLNNPKTGNRPYAVVQLRKENITGTMFNIVGFQTRLKYSEQARVFRNIPALKDAVFLRYGSVHRNTYINSSELLYPTLQFKKNSFVFFSGQITGVEGYIESALSGLIAGINAFRLSMNKKPLIFPDTTCHGALIKYISGISQTKAAKKRGFQPMHINFGLLPPISGDKRTDKKTKRKYISERAKRDLINFINNIEPI